MTVRYSEHFGLDTDPNLACPCCGQVKVDPHLIEVLEMIRNHFDRPVHINSGYRCDIHNKAIGGASPVSQHLKGKAADIVVQGVSPAKVQQYLADFDGGVGSYKTFTHVDVRGYKARWKA